MRLRVVPKQPPSQLAWRQQLHGKLFDRTAEADVVLRSYESMLHGDAHVLLLVQGSDRRVLATLTCSDRHSKNAWTGRMGTF